jgi:acetoin utilization deacetylase AcuC-like enzyme
MGVHHPETPERLHAIRDRLIASGLDMLVTHYDAEDDMAQFNLREPDYAWVTRQLHDLAVKHAGERIVSCLEGGYDISALGRCVSTHLDELIGHA